MLSVKIGNLARQLAGSDRLATLERTAQAGHHSRKTMIHSVSVWRCKCGVRVKVVAELDENKLRATAFTSCPNCNEPHMMNANRIVLVSHQTIETLPDASEVENQP
jgi:hypothetical protein